MKKLTYLSLRDASQLSLDTADTTNLKEYVSIKDSLHRILYEDVICIKNLPSFDNSSMDGFAIRASDAGSEVQIKAIIFAGDSVEPCLDNKSCYKIMTGAKVPSDADTIVPIENIVEVKESSVVLPENIRKGDNKRYKGEEQAIGNVFFKKGTKLEAKHIAILASQGITVLCVYKKIRIAILSTGDELKEPWQSAYEDEIYNANSYALISYLEENGFDATYTGVTPDTLEATINYISEIKHYDVIITTGGISMGDADFVAKAYEANNFEVAFHGVNVKPGRPTMMGKMGSTYVMALPGNPLTAIMQAKLLSIPVLNKMQGDNGIYHSFVYAKNLKTFRVKSKRVNVVLGHLSNGEFMVTRDNAYGSGMLTPLVESNCILLTDESRESVEQGEIVKVILFNSNLELNREDIFN